MRLLTGHHEGLPVWDVAWSGDSMFLVSCGADRSLVVRRVSPMLFLLAVLSIECYVTGVCVVHPSGVEINS